MKFDDFRSNRSRDIRATHFVTDDDELHWPTDPMVISRTSYSVLPKNCFKMSVVQQICNVKCSIFKGFELMTCKQMSATIFSVNYIIFDIQRISDV